LKSALRRRYFADYARAWQAFLNSVQWQGDSTLSGTIDQLTLLADAQRSPLSALFKSISYQAGAGSAVKSLSDNLVSKAKQLVNGNDPDPANAMVLNPDETPLADAFGPLLRLSASSTAGGAAGAAANAALDQHGGMSLARYLERVTAVRLKLQQIMLSSDPDTMSRIAAQSILQGKTPDIADSREYASRVGASLGGQWSGFGSAVFERPLEQSWSVVLKPVAASLNDTWRGAIVSAWNSSFSGRYPFVDSDSDASLPELARFLRMEGGLIPQFVATQLAGVLERQGDQWVAT
jgi:type VI secretion system protein ImpL